ncbi:MAG: glutamyl-tRNA reductase [Myxococcota bacterium]|nr:glutamyl-tRNA reductase [Myxococcota bacterium]
MELCCIGVSHHSAPLSVRERLAVPGERQQAILRTLAERGREALLVSTCNRVEFYVAAGEVQALKAEIRDAILDLAGAEALGHLYEHEGEKALTHLFRVASSLDSMVVGEPQILGQVKDALELAQGSGSARGELTRACSAAFSTAKRVRTETAIGRSSVSMASAAVALAKKIFGELTGKSVMVVGAGEMAELAARHLASEGVARIVVTNRTLEKAQALAALVGGEARPFEELAELQVAADVIITCTASPTPLFTRASVAPALKPRRHRPLFLVDLAVPRDVDPEVGELVGVYAYDVDDLQRVIAENTATRAAEAARAEVIVVEEVARFVQIRAQRRGTPVLGQLRKKAEGIARAEVERTLQSMGPALTEKQRRSVEAMGMAIVNKLLHQPTARLRAQDGAGLADAAAELFGLDESPEATEEAPAPLAAVATGGSRQ